MSRRRLEAAIQAGREIAEGRKPADRLECCCRVYHTHNFDPIWGGVFSLQYSHDGNKLAVGYGDGGVQILLSKTGASKHEARPHRANGLAVTCLRFNPEQQHLCYAASADGTVTMCSSLQSTASNIVVEPGNEINCLDFNSNGSVFATGGRDLHIRLYDTETNKMTVRYPGYDYYSADQNEIAGHARRIFALRFHPDEKDVFLSGGWDNHLKIWDTRTVNGVQRVINGPHICGDALDIKGKKILTGSWVASDALQLWDLPSGKLLQSVPVMPADTQISGTGDHRGLVNKGEYLYCAQFLEGDLVMAGGTGNSGVVVLDTSTSQVLVEQDFGKSVQAMDTTNGGRRFAFGGAAGKLKLAEMS